MQMPVRDFHEWSVKDKRDQINLLSGYQARYSLQAIREGKSLEEAIAIGFSQPDKD